MSGDFKADELEIIDWKDLMNGGYEKRYHPFQYFFNYKLFKGNTILGYKPYHVIFQLPSFLYNRFSDFLYEVKWAYQRVVRGWDDRASWSLDSWVTENVLEILKVLKESKLGIPSSMFEGLPYEDEERCTHSEESYKIAEERWNTEVNKMITGFEAAKKIHDSEWKTLESYKELEAVFQEGVKSFAKYYFSLWD